MDELPDLVEPQNACPTCGERCEEKLIWEADDSTWVKCSNCGFRYEPKPDPNEFVIGPHGAYRVSTDESNSEEGLSKDATGQSFGNTLLRIEEVHASQIDVVGKDDPLHIIVTGEELVHLAAWIMGRVRDNMSYSPR